MAEKKGIDTALVMLLGALRQADIVTGPERCEVPPQPIWHGFDDGRELVAMGTLICGEDGKPTLHLHGAVGHDETR
jgi:predicted DNA-binding protein with PD1-like motif